MLDAPVSWFVTFMFTTACVIAPCAGIYYSIKYALGKRTVQVPTDLKDE